MRSANTVLRLSLVAFFALAIAADAQAKIYFVNPLGNDNNPGTSLGTAFKTIKRAAAVVSNGDTVYVAAGTYTDEIVVNGVQASNVAAVFIGSNGATVNAQWKVLNSNHVQIKGFTFKNGGANRLLVWKGSYQGLIEDCTFDSGSQALLVKNGSLTIDRAQITNFGQEGLQVDGEARLIVRNSTISGCKKPGVEIRKVANVIFENCKVQDNLGNGIDVNVTTDSIDPGPDGPGRWHGSVPLAGADGPISIVGSGSIIGDLYHPPQYPVDPSAVSGTLYKLPGSMTFPPIDPGNAATNNNNANIPKTDLNKTALSPTRVFSLDDNDGVTLPAGTYYFSSMDCKPNSNLRVSGPTRIYVTGNVLFKGKVNATGSPSNLLIYVMGSLVDITSQAVVKAGFYAPDATIEMRGGSAVEGMVLADKIDMAGSSQITTHTSLESVATMLLPAPPTVPLPPASWAPVSTGELDVSGSAFTKNASGIRINTKQKLNTRASDFSQNTGWGLSLFGVSRVEDCTFKNNATGGVRLQSIDTADLTVRNLILTDNTQYGLYAASCGLTFNSTNIGHWKISGSQVAIMGQTSDLTFDTVTVSGGSVAAVQCDQSTVTAVRATFSNSGNGMLLAKSNATIDQCTFSGNSVGLYANQNASLLVKSSTLTDNSVWGAAVYGGGSAGATNIDGCTIRNNTGGLSIVNAVDGQVALRAGTVLRDNTDAGLHFDGCNITVNNQAAQGWQITGNKHGINSANSTLRLDGLTIQGNTHGAWLASSNVTITNSKFSGGAYGLWAENNNSLDVTTSTFSGNSAYGVQLQGNGSLRQSAITGNGSGLYLNATNVTDANLTGTQISGNTLYGVYSYNASLALTAQSTEGWSIDDNGYNISGYQAAITLTGAKMTGATNYGVLAQYGSLNVQQSTIASNSGGVWGFYLSGFTVDRSHIKGSNSGSWAVANYESGLMMRNTVVSGAQYGVYSYDVVKPVAIYNSTIADASQYGVYAYNGDLTLMNTIVAGTGGTYGLSVGPSANVVHSYNLVHGFAIPFENTAADPTELSDPPLFKDPANGDYSLAKGSPAINSGTDMSASHTVDMMGNARPSHKVFEIGAYEYMQDAGSLRILDWKETR